MPRWLRETTSPPGLPVSTRQSARRRRSSPASHGPRWWAEPCGPHDPGAGRGPEPPARTPRRRHIRRRTWCASESGGVPRPGLGQTCRDAVHGRRGDDQQTEETQQQQDGDRAPHRETGLQRTACEIPDHAARRAQPREPVTRRGRPRRQMRQTTGREQQRRHADRDAIHTLVVIRLTQDQQTDEQQHQRHRQGHQTHRARRDRMDRLAHDARQTPPLTRRDDDRQRDEQQTHTVTPHSTHRSPRHMSHTHPRTPHRTNRPTRTRPATGPRRRRRTPLSRTRPTTLTRTSITRPRRRRPRRRRTRRRRPRGRGTRRPTPRTIRAASRRRVTRGHGRTLGENPLEEESRDPRHAAAHHRQGRELRLVPVVGLSRRSGPHSLRSLVSSRARQASITTGMIIGRRLNLPPT